MTRRWYGFAREGSHQELRDALQMLSPSGLLDFMPNASDLRVRLRDEEPGDVGVIVGPCDEGVSDINLAAAIVADGCAGEVVLVAHGVSGSLRSRAACAGVTRVIDGRELASPTPGTALVHDGEEGRPAGHVARVGEKGASGRPVEVPAMSQVSDMQSSRAVHAPVVTFASGRGGVGKTTVAATCAVTAGRWGLRVALLDLDLSCGNLHACLGLPHGADLARIVCEGRLDHVRLGTCGVPCYDGVVVWGPCNLPEMAETVSPVVGEIIAGLATMSDLVIVDTSSTCTDTLAQAMQLSDRLVIVHDAERPEFASVARMSALAVRLGVARMRIARVENRSSLRSVGQPFMPRAELGLEAARAFRVIDGGDVVADLMLDGNVGALCDEGGGFVESTSVFLAQMLEELGSLPDCDGARKAARGLRRRAGLPLFARRREAV